MKTLRPILCAFVSGLMIFIAVPVLAFLTLGVMIRNRKDIMYCVQIQGLLFHALGLFHNLLWHDLIGKSKSKDDWDELDRELKEISR